MGEFMWQCVNSGKNIKLAVIVGVHLSIINNSRATLYNMGVTHHSNIASRNSKAIAAIHCRLTNEHIVALT